MEFRDDLSQCLPEDEHRQDERGGSCHPQRERKPQFVAEFIESIYEVSLRINGMGTRLDGNNQPEGGGDVKIHTCVM